MPPPKKRWRHAPSPCIGVCRFKDGERCIGCTMTRDSKRLFATLREKGDKKRFLARLVARLHKRGKLARWEARYRAKCLKRGVPCPLDRLDTPRREEVREAA